MIHVLSIKLLKWTMTVTYNIHHLNLECAQLSLANTYVSYLTDGKLICLSSRGGYPPTLHAYLSVVLHLGTWFALYIAMGLEAGNLEAIRKQIEYYFSDSNLPRDKYLRAKTEENEQGYVSISVLLTFKRLQALEATTELITQALATSQLIDVHEDGLQIRRVSPLPDTPQWINRSIYAKGWNPKGPEPSIESVNDLFSPSGDILSVRIRRWKDEEGRHFKGSIFVEFVTAEAAERAAAEEYSIDTSDADGKPVTKKLLTMLVDAYFEKKKQEARERMRRTRLAKSNSAKQAAGAAKASTRRSEQEPANGGNVQTAQNDTRRVPTASPDDRHDKDAVVPSKPATANGSNETKKREIVPGMVLRFEGFGPDVSREDIKEAFEPLGEVAWVDFKRGDADGHIRFSRQGAAEAAVTAMTEAKTQFGGKVPKFFLITGDAERAYWEETWEKQDSVAENARKRRRESNRGFGGKRRRGKGARHGASPGAAR